jgi:hypothetical protein
MPSLHTHVLNQGGPRRRPRISVELVKYIEVKIPAARQSGLGIIAMMGGR